MFGFGGLGEIAFILFVAMLIFGPEKLPEIGRLLAKGMAEVRKASNELKRTLNAELAVSEQEAEARRLAALSPPASPMASTPAISPTSLPAPDWSAPVDAAAASAEPPLFPADHAAVPELADAPEAAHAPEVAQSLDVADVADVAEGDRVPVADHGVPMAAAVPVFAGGTRFFASSDAAPTIRAAAMTVPASPPGAAATAVEPSGGLEIPGETPDDAGETDRPLGAVAAAAAAPAAGEPAEPLAPYGQGRGAVDGADADVN
jgi:sec-independent protein translocase protein TatA